MSLGEDLIVVAAAGDAGGVVEGARVDLSELPDNLYASLIAGQYVKVQGADATVLGRLLDRDTEYGAILVCPLDGGEGPGGAIVAASGSQISAELEEAFQTLSSQISLALDSVALAEDLHRRRSEARLGSLVQNATDIIAVLEENGVVRYASPASGSWATHPRG